MPTPTFSFKSNWQQLAEALTVLANTFIVNQGVMMSTLSDLTDTVTGLDAKVDNLIAVVTHLSAASHLTAEDQAKLDAAVAELQGEEVKVDVANPPVPPAPAP